MARVELTKPQRDWIHDRANSLSEWTGKDANRKEIHHIRPIGWQVYHYNEPPEEYNSPFRLILITEQEHHLIHPDVIEALHNYRFDKDSFKSVFSRRRRLMEMGCKYWVTRWDEKLLDIAMKRTIDFVERGNPFPLRKTREV